MNLIIFTLIQAVFILAVAPFALGLVRFFKARFQGRKGPSVFLPYVTLAVFLRKEMVISNVASVIFRIAPFAVLGSAIFLTFIIPLILTSSNGIAFSDFLVVAGVLSFGSIFLVLGGLDTGSAFGGMGSSRELTISALLEPAIILVFSAISFATKESTINGMLLSGSNLLEPYLILTIIALILVALAENARYPVDNPATHLELTMVHEAMLLEYSGKYLAMLEYASAIKLAVFSLLVANFIFPGTLVETSSWSPSFLVGSLFFALLKIIVAMGVLAFIESVLTKMRFYRMSEYFSIAFIVAFLGMVVAFLSSFTKISLQFHVLFSIFTVIFLVILFGQVRLKAILRYYALSSLAIAGIAWGLFPFVNQEDRFHLGIFAIFTIGIKTLLVPYLINRSSHAKKSLTNLPSFLRPGKSYFLAVGLLIVSYFIFRSITVSELVEWDSLLYTSIASIILGITMMIIERNIFSQIVGILVMENGIAVLVLATIGSLPILIEFGIFAVTVATVYILSILSGRINDLSGSADTEELRGLTE